MGDPNQSLMEYQTQEYPTPLIAPPAPQLMSVQPPPVYAPPNALALPPPQEPLPPPVDVNDLLNRKFGGQKKTVDASSLDAKQPQLSLTEDQIKQMALAKDNEERIARDERRALASGLMRSRVVGPSEQQLQASAVSGDMASSVGREAELRKDANEFRADTEIRRQEAYAKFAEEENAKHVARHAAIDKELDDRFAKVDAMSEAGTDNFWKSREAGARARAIEAIGGWRLANDTQAIFMHNPSGANASNEAFDMYKHAIDQDVAVQMKNRDFAAGQLKERIAILGSREAAEMSLRKEKFDEMAAKWDAFAAQAKTPEAKADNEVIARKAMAASQQLKMDMYALTKPHVSQEVDKMFYLNNLDKFKERPEVLDTLAPQFSKQVGAAEKGRAEIGKLEAESSKARGESSSEDASKLESQLQKSGVFPMHSYDELFKKAEKGEVPGLGRVGRFVSDKPGISAMNSEDEQKNNVMLRSLTQDLIHLRTGAQASDKERIQHTIALISSGSSRDISVGIQQAKQLFSETESRIKAGFGKKTVDAYNARLKQEQAR